MSYDGTMTFGLNADHDSVADLEVMRAGIEQSLTDLRRLGGIGETRRPNSHAG